MDALDELDTDLGEDEYDREATRRMDMCRNRLCVNPDHLQAVNRLANNENRSLEGYGGSGVRGVSWHKATSTYEAYATHGNKKYSAGRYSTLEEAAEAAQELRLKLHQNNLVDRGKGASHVGSA